jgi:excisionase family DNA binding protein
VEQPTAVFDRWLRCFALSCELASKPNVETAQQRGFGMAYSHSNERIVDDQVPPLIDSRRAFSVEEFCKRYGLGRTRAYQELKSGRLRARKIGRRTVITEDDAEDWLRRLPLMKITKGHGEVMS